MEKGSSVLLITVFCVIFLALPESSESATDKVFCYYGSWATYRSGNAAFPVESIDPYLCTHLIYTFVGLGSSGQVNILDTYAVHSLGQLTKLVKLKEQNPSLKVLVAMGGWNEGSTIYSLVTGDPTLRSRMVDNIVKFLDDYELDGFDLDWEYPADRGGALADKQNYITLLQLLRERFDPKGYILSAAVGVSPRQIQASYNIPEMAKYLHFINLMSYDLRGSWDQVIGQHSALYASPLEGADYSALNVDAVVTNWLNEGVPAEKLIMGIPLYGRTFTLASSSNSNVGSYNRGAGQAGKYSWEAGSLMYLEICELLSDNTWTQVWNEAQQVPYAFKGDQWVGYDNQKSAKIKAEYAKRRNLGGVMVWSIEQDDSRGVCGHGVFPMMKALWEGLALEGPSVTMNPVTVTSSTSSAVTQVPVTAKTTTTPNPIVGGESEFKCTRVGNYRDPLDCSVYYMCQPLSDGAYQTHKRNCNAGLYFDSGIQGCNWPALVKDC